MTADIFPIRRLDRDTLKPAAWMRLIKLRISLMASIATLTGYILHQSTPGFETFLAAGGVFLLAAGAGALNHYQDRGIDRLCTRTCDRPLPRGQLSSRQAVALAGLLLLAGLLCLACLSTGRIPVFLGLLAAGIYNGVYTPLKKITSLALIPGSLGGMLPPLIGWTAAGGGILTFKIWVLMVALGLWQMPHFWLLLLSNRQDFHDATLPHLLDTVALGNFKRIVFVWILGFAVIILTLPLVHIVMTPAARWILLGSSGFLVGFSAYVLLKEPQGTGGSILFNTLNIQMGLVLVLILIDSLALKQAV